MQSRTTVAGHPRLMAEQVIFNWCSFSPGVVMRCLQYHQHGVHAGIQHMPSVAHTGGQTYGHLRASEPSSLNNSSAVSSTGPTPAGRPSAMTITTPAEHSGSVSAASPAAVSEPRVIASQQGPEVTTQQSGSSSNGSCVCSPVIDAHRGLHDASMLRQNSLRSSISEPLQARQQMPSPTAASPLAQSLDSLPTRAAHHAASDLESQDSSGSQSAAHDLDLTSDSLPVGKVRQPASEALQEQDLARSHQTAVNSPRESTFAEADPYGSASLPHLRSQSVTESSPESADISAGSNLLDSQSAMNLVGTTSRARDDTQSMSAEVVASGGAPESPSSRQQPAATLSSASQFQEHSSSHATVPLPEQPALALSSSLLHSSTEGSQHKAEQVAEASTSNPLEGVCGLMLKVVQLSDAESVSDSVSIVKHDTSSEERMHAHGDASSTWAESQTDVAAAELPKGPENKVHTHT